MHVHRSFILTAPKWKQPKFPSKSEWANELGSIHTVEHYSAVQKNELGRNATHLRNVSESKNNYAK